MPFKHPKVNGTTVNMLLSQRLIHGTTEPAPGIPVSSILTAGLALLSLLLPPLVLPDPGVELRLPPLLLPSSLPAPSLAGGRTFGLELPALWRDSSLGDLRERQTCSDLEYSVELELPRVPV